MRHPLLTLVSVAGLTLLGCGDGEMGPDEITPALGVMDVGPVSDDATGTPLTLDTATQPDEDDGTIVGSDSSLAPEEPPQGSPCASPLVELQTAKDPTCAGGNVHRWPIGMAPTACHGWRAVDPSGQQHDNSANAIGCGDDGSFTFTQFAGNLDCGGSGVVKTYIADACAQDIPPALYTKAINLACCEDLAHPDCVTGAPSVTIPGGQTFLDGVLCE